MTIKEEISWLSTYIKSMPKNSPTKVAFQSILNRLKRLSNKEPPSQYHAQAIGVYRDWLAGFGLPAIVDARQGAAMKEILLQLKDVSNTKTEEMAFESLKAILQHWSRVGPYLEKRKQLTQIKDNLLEIIDKIKNGGTRKIARTMEADKVHDELRREYRRNNG